MELKQGPVCPKCKSERTVRRGFVPKKMITLHQCMECGCKFRLSITFPQEPPRK